MLDSARTPLDFLHSAIASIPVTATRPVAVSHVGQPTGLMSKLVLIAEDDPDQRRLLERMFIGSGYRVVAVPDGDAAVHAVSAVRPDIAILDVMMPKMNGFQTCRALRASPDTAQTPIIMLTSKNQPADSFWAAEVGASAFLQKPVEIVLLLDTVARLLDPK